MLISDYIVQELHRHLGCKLAFGISGIGISPFWTALARNKAIRIIHARQESNAACAATEAFFALECGAPRQVIIVFAPTGPGIANAINGLMAARTEGAAILFVSGSSPCALRGRWPTQETSETSTRVSGLFDHEVSVQVAAQAPVAVHQIISFFKARQHGVAHLSLCLDVLVQPIDTLSVVEPAVSPDALVPNESGDSQLQHVREASSPCTVNLTHIAPLLRGCNTATDICIWVGFGARHDAAAVTELAERLGCAVLSTPRGKGIFAESHAQYIGVTGIGGHDTVLQHMKCHRPRYIIVLGSRLGEAATAGYSSCFVPSDAFIHVDIAAEVPGRSYAGLHGSRTIPIVASVRSFIVGILPILADHAATPFDRSQDPFAQACPMPSLQPAPAPASSFEANAQAFLHPVDVMCAVQRLIVDNSSLTLLAECGNSFAWASHCLRFDQPHRFRCSTYWGSLCHASSGVLGAAVAQPDRGAVAIVGDGDMLMGHEISTAVHIKAFAIWIVLNDSCYNICRQGIANGFICRFHVLDSFRAQAHRWLLLCCYGRLDSSTHKLHARYRHSNRGLCQVCPEHGVCRYRSPHTG